MFAAIGTIFNIEAILVSMVEQIYFYSPDHKKASRIKLSFLDHVSRPFSMCISVFKEPSCRQRNFILAVDKIKEDLDVVLMIQTIRKL